MQKTPSLLFAITTLLLATWAYSAPPARVSQPIALAQADAKRSEGNEQGDKPAAKEAEPVSAETSSAALAVLKRARLRIADYHSIEANISEKVSILDHSFTAKGSYLQGEKMKSMLEFSLELGGNTGSLLEVCDGQLLWTRHQIADQVQITRRDVREILAAAERSRRVPVDLLTVELGLGGMPALLAAFEQEIDFEKVAEDTIDKQPVTVIEGKWNKAFRDRFAAARAPDQPENALPLYVPDAIRVYFDKETEFPRRILYLKQIPNRKVSRAMLTLDFTKVKINGRIDEQKFTFVPPSAPVATDVTQLYLQRLNAAPPEDGPTQAPLNRQPPPGN